MSEREELEKLRRLRNLEAKEAKFLGVKLPGVRVGVTGPIAEDTGGFLKNALVTASKRAAQLGQRLPGTSSTPQQKQEVQQELEERTAQPGGSTGVFLGDTLATLPFAGAGKAVQAGRALVNASRLGRAATGKTAAAATEGAMIGQFLNDDAGTGAVTSVLLNTLARGAGKLATGPVAKSDEALALQQVAQSEGVPLELPVAVAAKNPLVRKAFGDVLPSVPGAQKSMAAQKAQVQGQLDNLAAVRGVESQPAASLLGSEIRDSSPVENRMAWALASTAGLAPTLVPAARAASSTPVNKALLGEYKVQESIKKIGEKIKPLTAALRRVVALEASEDE